MSPAFVSIYLFAYPIRSWESTRVSSCVVDIFTCNTFSFLFSNHLCKCIRYIIQSILRITVFIKIKA